MCATDNSARQPNTRSASDPIADEIMRAIRRILRRTAEHSRQLSRDGDLSVPQLLCLRKVSEAGRENPVTVAEVAAAVQLSIATVSRILDRLEAAELIVRQRSTHDRRKVFLHLTASGKRRIKKLPAPLQEEFLARLSKLSRPEQRSLLAALEMVVDMMGAADLEVAPMLTPDADIKASRRD